MASEEGALFAPVFAATIASDSKRRAESASKENALKVVRLEELRARLSPIRASLAIPTPSVHVQDLTSALPPIPPLPSHFSPLSASSVSHSNAVTGESVQAPRAATSDLGQLGTSSKKQMVRQYLVCSAPSPSPSESSIAYSSIIDTALSLAHHI